MSREKPILTACEVKAMPPTVPGHEKSTKLSVIKPMTDSEAWWHNLQGCLPGEHL